MVGALTALLLLAVPTVFTLPFELLPSQDSTGLAIKYDPLSQKEFDLSERSYFKESATKPAGAENTDQIVQGFALEKRAILTSDIPKAEEQQVEVPWYQRFGSWVESKYHSAKNGVKNLFSTQNKDKAEGQLGGYPDFYSFNS